MDLNRVGHALSSMTTRPYRQAGAGLRVRGSGRRPEDDTPDPGRFPISQGFGGGWKVDLNRVGYALSSMTTRLYRQAEAGL